LLQEFVVLGGGLAGLTFALEAARRGRPVAVLESDSQVGGLARTLAWGDYRFDLGGHRFHSPQSHLTAWVRDLMGDDLLEVIRRSRIQLDGRYVDYPLQLLNALCAFSPPKAVQVLVSYLKASLRRNAGQPDVTFEDWVSHRFGQALYDIYFRPYTEKVWGLDCTELSADWASQRIKLPSLTAAVKGSLWGSSNRPATLVSRFLYPRLGIGMIPDRLAEKALSTEKVAIHLDSQVFRLQAQEEQGGWQVYYRQAGQERVVTARQVISTIPLGSLLCMLPRAAGDEPLPLAGDQLAYRGVICIFLALDGPRLSADTWTYFPGRHLVFGRTHEPLNWSASMVPAGKTSLGLEVFASPGDETWQCPDAALIDRALADLARLGLVARDRVRDAWVVRVPHAYPIYRVGYADQLDHMRKYLARWPTLHLLGRTGSFCYLNMDGTIDQALRLVEVLAASGSTTSP
jgi:protoporphyrinogen oxidase